MPNNIVEHLLAIGVIIALAVAAYYFPFENNDNDDFLNPGI